MAEVLIRVKDKGPRVEQSKRGDVVCICPDGWPWSERELTNPEWRIIRVPLLPTQISTLLSQPMEHYMSGSPLPVPRRKYRFKLDNLLSLADLLNPEIARPAYIDIAKAKTLTDVAELVYQG